MAEALTNLFEDACYYVSVDGGRITYQSIFERDWKEAGGDFEYLLVLIEDHIYEDDDNDGDESIDWNAVEKQYWEEKCKKTDSSQLTLPNYPAISS